MKPLHRLAVVTLGSAGALALAAAGLAADAPQPVKLSWLSPPGDAARGAKIAAVCLSCHAAGAPATDPVAPRLHRQRVSYLFAAVAAFRSGERQSPLMGPMVKDLSDQDLRDVAVYLAGEMLDKPPKSNEADPYYRYARAHCTMCHGESGIGEMEGMPVLTGQDPAYLRNALEEYRKGIRKDPTMREVAGNLTPADEQGMAAYFAQYQWLEKQK
ncbi:MAG: c-type cytochrome [Candidatus Andeanibacterium colombiense]|uniref:C-type cytochrome n=1 Tax=Candidatus Andeanibacterium colombiense TaxID=3121345 RepID=A0AAJ5X4S8_9SPHN|nr:MAG: c-type cytochrome [Sphingomonadaceae bacterium]